MIWTPETQKWIWFARLSCLIAGLVSAKAVIEMKKETRLGEFK